MKDVATSRVLYEMFWNQEFAQDVYGAVSPDAFEHRAAIAAVIGDHDSRIPDPPPHGVDRVLSIVAVFHEHAARNEEWRRQRRQWASNGRRAPEPVSPYRSVTPLNADEIDPALLARSGTMLITGEVVQAVSVEDRVLKLGANEALTHLAARHGAPGAHPRRVPIVGVCGVDHVAGADVQYGQPLPEQR